MAVFDFKVSHPEFGDYYTGKITAEDAARARELLAIKLEERFPILDEDSDRVAVPVEDSKITVSEVKLDG